MPTIPDTLKPKIQKLCTLVQAQQSELETLRAEKAKSQRTEAAHVVAKAIEAGKIAAHDSKTQTFWVNTVLAGGSEARDALQALPSRTPSDRVVHSSIEDRSAVQSKMQQQQKAIAEARASMPTASFDAVFSKAQDANPKAFA